MAITSPYLVINELAKLLIPPKPLTISEFADEHYYLSAKNSGNPGKWKTRPYQKAILDAVSDPRYWRVTVKKSARVGYTKCLNAVVSYHMAHDPCPMSLIQPTVGDAEEYSRDEIASLIADVPVVNKLFRGSKFRDGTNNLLEKHFPGGIFTLFGANSPGGFRRITRRIMLLDEVDGYPSDGAGKEGDQVALAINRTIDFWNRCLVEGSTPTVDEYSRIDKSYNASDQQKRFLPCPHCGHMQYLRWKREDDSYAFHWERGKPETVVYICESCNKGIQHKHKSEMDRNGEWRPTSQAEDPGHIGFHIWAAYSPQANATWTHLVRAFEQMSPDPLQYQTWVNTWQGEVWRDDAASRITTEGLMERREEYGSGVIPDEKVLMLTLGIDVQDNRIEGTIWGWGAEPKDDMKAEPEGWMIKHVVIMGSYSSNDIWTEVDKLIAEQFDHPFGGKIKISTTLIDASDGDHSDYVYDYTNSRRKYHVYASKGTGSQGKPPINRGTKTEYDFKGKARKSSATIYMVGTDIIKTRLMARLRHNRLPGPGCLHFPSDTTGQFFDQLTSETRKVHYLHGAPKYRWERRKGAQAEALDASVYAYAALHLTYQRYNRNTIWQTMRDACAPKSELDSQKVAQLRSLNVLAKP